MMELKMVTDLDQAIPKEFLFNFDELKGELSSRIEYYKNVVITPDTIKEGKEDRAKLNKLRDALETRRKDVKKLCLEPYNEFESKIKVLVSLIDEPIQMYDKQLKAYEEQKREEKIDQVYELYERIVPENLTTVIPMVKIWDKSWGNVSTSLKSIEDAINNLVAKMTADLAAISRVSPEHLTATKLKYLEHLDLGAALKYCDELQAASEAHQQTQATENTPVEEKEPERAQETPAQPSEDKRYRLRLDMRLTLAQWEALKKCLEDNNILYTRM